MSKPQNSVSGGVKATLRIEALCVLVTCCFLYQHESYAWGRFFLFFLVPDLSFLGYFVNSRIGAAAYNAAHSYILPLTLGCVFYALDIGAALPFILIWIAHIGFDRALGYGLKYATAFGDTHLGTIGKKASSQEARS